jgi:hypothetical protein
VLWLLLVPRPQHRRHASKKAHGNHCVKNGFSVARSTPNLSVPPLSILPLLPSPLFRKGYSVCAFTSPGYQSIILGLGVAVSTVQAADCRCVNKELTP